MANGYTENIEKWKTLTDIDYFTYFIKAWISFNAWYRNHYQNVNSDREAINKIKNEGNTIKNKAIAMLGRNSTDEKSLTFKSSVASLHKALLELAIHNDNKRLCFDNFVIEADRANLVQNFNNRNIKYYLKIDENRGAVTSVLITVTKSNNTTILNYTHNSYDESHLINNNNYKNLSNSQQAHVLDAFRLSNPFKLENLLTSDESNSILIGSFRFINNEEKILKCLIEIIYGLRNALFHGEIVPNKEHRKIYEQAYKILKILLDFLE